MFKHSNKKTVVYDFFIKSKEKFSEHLQKYVFNLKEAKFSKYKTKLEVSFQNTSKYRGKP